MACEKNILDFPLDPSLPGSEEVVMYTKPDGTTVIRKVSTVAYTVKKPVYDCTGSEGTVVNFPELVGVPTSRIADIIRSGASCRAVVNTAPSGMDIQYDDGVVGDVTVATPLENGEFIKVIYI
jgi:hypothetical protein